MALQLFITIALTCLALYRSDQAYNRVRELESRLLRLEETRLGTR